MEKEASKTASKPATLRHIRSYHADGDTVELMSEVRI